MNKSIQEASSENSIEEVVLEEFRARAVAHAEGLVRHVRNFGAEKADFRIKFGGSDFVISVRAE